MRRKVGSLAVLFVALALAAGLIVSACHTGDFMRTDASTPAPTVDAAVSAPMSPNADYSLGYCRVALNAPAPCVEYRGKQASGVAAGCQHDNCTTAKQNARANLLTGIPAACGAYIQCNDPCRCIQKRQSGEVANSPTTP
jgi:hypothetical protein